MARKKKLPSDDFGHQLTGRNEAPLAYTKTTNEVKDKTDEFGESTTISASSFVEHKINVYIANNYINNLKDSDIYVIKEKMPFQFEYDYDKFSEIFLDSMIVFIYKHKIHVLMISCDSQSLQLEGDYAHEIYKSLMIQIRENNPLRNKQIYIRIHQGRMDYQLKKPTSLTLKDVILDENFKSDIYDNTLYHMEHIDGCNGVIFEGPPGTGKTITCSAIINEAIQKGYTCCYITTEVVFSELETFIDTMLSPCFVVFEDIDSLGQNRRDTINTSISPLLQLLSGLTEKNNKIVYIATTNYIEHLDEALKNRPVRFNRKFKFSFPVEVEIDRLIDLYFKEKITDDNKKLCYNLKFTGSHIKELKRTCDIHVKKYNKKYNEVFSDSVQIIKDNFFTGSVKTGFQL